MQSSAMPGTLQLDSDMAVIDSKDTGFLIDEFGYNERVLIKYIDEIMEKPIETIMEKAIYMEKIMEKMEKLRYIEKIMKKASLMKGIPLEILKELVNEKEVRAEAMANLGVSDAMRALEGMSATDTTAARDFVSIVVILPLIKLKNIYSKMCFPEHMMYLVSWWDGPVIDFEPSKDDANDIGRLSLVDHGDALLALKQKSATDSRSARVLNSIILNLSSGDVETVAEFLRGKNDEETVAEYFRDKGDAEKFVKVSPMVNGDALRALIQMSAAYSRAARENLPRDKNELKRGEGSGSEQKLEGGDGGGLEMSGNRSAPPYGIMTELGSGAAGKAKAKAEAETNLGVGDDSQAFNQMSATDSKGASQLERSGLSPPDQKPEGSGGFLMKVAAKSIASLSAKVTVDKALGALEMSGTHSAPPLVKEANVLGLLLVLAGILLSEKKPRLSKFVLKFGGVVTALSVLSPMILNLHENPAMAYLFGGITTAIIIGTAAHC